MIRIAIDASTPICDIALIHDEVQNEFMLWEEGRGIHSDRLFQGIQELLNKANITINQVDEWITTGGPGSYTGLRISASALKGILFGTNKSLISVQTLAYFARSMANAKPEKKRFHACIDARRTHLYHQFFEIENNSVIQTSKPQILAIDKIKSLIEFGDCIGGTGIDRLGLEWLSEKEIFVIESKKVINPLILAKFTQNNSTWKSFVHIVEPALFEPEYFTSGIEQVHSK
jgi:tRNA threonylcarbamoyladenosine biosynthesis protein TsaB